MTSSRSTQTDDVLVTDNGMKTFFAWRKTDVEFPFNGVLIATLGNQFMSAIELMKILKWVC